MKRRIPGMRVEPGKIGQFSQFIREGRGPFLPAKRQVVRFWIDSDAPWLKKKTSRKAIKDKWMVEREFIRQRGKQEWRGVEVMTFYERKSPGRYLKVDWQRARRLFPIFFD